MTVTSGASLSMYSGTCDHATGAPFWSHTVPEGHGPMDLARKMFFDNPELDAFPASVVLETMETAVSNPGQPAQLAQFVFVYRP